MGARGNHTDPNGPWDWQYFRSATLAVQKLHLHLRLCITFRTQESDSSNLVSEDIRYTNFETRDRDETSVDVQAANLKKSQNCRRHCKCYEATFDHSEHSTEKLRK